MASVTNKVDFASKSGMKISLLQTLIGHEGAIYKLIPGHRPGTFLSCGGEGYVVEWTPDLSEKGQLVARDTDSIYCMNLFHHDQLYLGTKNGMLISCDVSKHQEPRKLDIHKKGIYSISGNDDFIFTAGGDGWLRILKREKLHLQFSIQLSGKSLRSVILIPENNMLLVGGTESKIFQLDSVSFELISTIDSTHDNSIFCLLKRTPEQFYSTGRDARLNLNSIKPAIENILSVPAHMNTVNDLALNPQASLLASVSRDRSVKIWKPETLELLKVIDNFKFRSHTHSINAVMWLDNEVLITAGDDRLIKVWKIEA